MVGWLRSDGVTRWFTVAARAAGRARIARRVGSARAAKTRSSCCGEAKVIYFHPDILPFIYIQRLRASTHFEISDYPRRPVEEPLSKLTPPPANTTVEAAPTSRPEM